MLKLIEISKGTFINPANVLAISETTNAEGVRVMEFVFSQGGLQAVITPQLEEMVLNTWEFNYLASPEPENVVTPDEVLPI